MLKNVKSNGQTDFPLIDSTPERGRVKIMQISYNSEGLFGNIKLIRYFLRVEMFQIEGKIA